jgi:GTPase involved in cell partitioning and DNA repair
MDGLKSRGYTLRDTSSKNAVLQKIKEELDYYENTLNTNVSTYVASSLDYVSDGRTLNKVRNNRQHIQDLKDISRYVESINTKTFSEAYMDLEIEKIKFNDSVQQTKKTNFNIELLWFANLVVLGFIFFV